MTVGDTSGLGYQRLLLAQPVTLRPAIDHVERLSHFPGGSCGVRAWLAEDDVYVAYSTSAIVGGPHHGKFFVQTFGLHVPEDGFSVRTTTYERTFSRRSTAKARALQIYADHSPKWARRNGY